MSNGEDLEAIEARLNAAEKGPWEIGDAEDDSGWSIVSGSVEIAVVPWSRSEEDQAQTEADAEFIAHAPEDMRRLIAEVRRLRTLGAGTTAPPVPEQPPVGPMRDMVCAEEVKGTGDTEGGFLVSLECGHKRFVREKWTEYLCRECGVPK